ISDITNDKTKYEKTNNVSLKLPDNTDLYFKTHNSLKNSWKSLINKHPPQRTDKKKEIKRYSKEMSYGLLKAGNLLAQYEGFKEVINFIEEEVKIVSTIGVTIGGRKAQDIKINNNVIRGFLQGVHIGLSHENNQTEPYSSKNVIISDNIIYNVLPPYIHKLERYGIIVGNCFNLLIENNTILVDRIKDYGRRKSYNDVLIEGIRVWGYLGLRMKIASNTIHGESKQTSNSFNKKLSYDIAIKVISTSIKPIIAQWEVKDNILLSKQNNLDLDNSVNSNNNTP
ncbi:MAG: hypothetical protein AAFP82_10195, partial [Bacteroidota bacterium]